MNGVTVLGPLNLASDLAADASRMFSRNAEKLVLYLLDDGELSFDFENEIVKGCVVTHDGAIVDEQVAEASPDPAGRTSGFSRLWSRHPHPTHEAAPPNSHRPVRRRRSRRGSRREESPDA